MTELACLGDLHLSHTVWDDHPDIRDDAILNTARFLDLAHQRNCEVILCGDIFDVVNPPPSVIREFRILMDMCQSMEMKVYYFQGNHDKRPVPWPMALHDHPIYVGDGKPFKIGNLTCVALDYLGRERIETAIQEVNKNPPDVLFLHQAVKQALKFENAWNCDLDWVSPKTRKVILGDIHKAMDMKFPGGVAHYTGASSPRNIDELGDKSFLVLKQDLTTERVALPSRPMKRVTLSESSVDEITQWAVSAVSEAYTTDPVGRLHPVLFLRYTAQETAVATKLRDDLHSDVPSKRLKVVLQAIEDVQHGTFSVDDKPGDTVVDLLNKRLDQGSQKREYGLVLELWQSPEDPVDIITSHRKAFSASNKA